MDDFQDHRPHLWGVAYRIVGTVTDADDAVQETWLRWRQVDHAGVEDPRAYLTTVVSRICYDLLTSAKAKREAYVGEWLPEPVVDQLGPDEQVALDESVGLALLAVMERLTPAERTSLVLHDVFAVPYDEIADIVGRTPDAVRQLASRARRRVREYAPQGTVDRAEHLRAVEAFAVAATTGDLPGLVAVLDPKVVWRSDGGGLVVAARVPVVGAETVARLISKAIQRWSAEFDTEMREINGAPGFVLWNKGGGVDSVLSLVVADGRIIEIGLVRNPEKLRHLAV
ncbi:RNA polymerase sigma factor SigJ [Sinosporangium siamense]|uniref:RNA polymerase sigma24 factor n=1 Tax=Sinosporangium siamense TaxID=1367973 RepID=A0A919V744_9ACTN|nr:RNA polymerase sigma factor SigJ [Sinosporangium siamense]GII94725.1 RNA polymerase sigma24 factor [Sinosporangium siamense]